MLDAGVCTRELVREKNLRYLNVTFHLFPLPVSRCVGTAETSVRFLISQPQLANDIWVSIKFISHTRTRLRPIMNIVLIIIIQVSKRLYCLLLIFFLIYAFFFSCPLWQFILISLPLGASAPLVRREGQDAMLENLSLQPTGEAAFMALSCFPKALQPSLTRLSFPDQLS